MNKLIPKYILVEKYIKKEIKQKKVVDKLPSERVLAKQLGFSYMTIRKAIDNLVGEGLVYKIPTKGVFINNKPQVKKTRTIGYFLDSSIVAGLSSPYYSMIFNAIEKQAARHNYSVIYFSDTNKHRLDNTISRLDGVIATCLPKTENVILNVKSSVPVVVIDNPSSDKSIPSIIIDNFNADIESVDYICSLGHKKIGFMMGLENSDVGKNRYSGYLYGLKKNNLKFDESLIYNGNYSYQSGIDGAKYFLSLKNCPSAIICANDSMALGAIKEFKKSGFDVPDDISIIGFDDIEVASQITPALTTIKAPIDEIAQHSFNILKNLIDSTQLDYQHITLATKLIVRNSCAKAKK